MQKRLSAIFLALLIVLNMGTAMAVDCSSSVTLYVAGNTTSTNNGSNGNSSNSIKKTNVFNGTDIEGNHFNTSSSSIVPNVAQIIQGYIEGYPDGTFKPLNGLSREEYATIIYRILEFDKTTYTKHFSDVAEGRWSYEAIETMAEYGIIEGVGNGRYEPEREITQEEAILILDRILDTDKYSTELKVEITGSVKGRAALSRLYNAGILNSLVVNGEIQGKETIKRWQIVSVINKIVYSDLATTNWNVFSDISEQDSYYKDVLKSINIKKFTVTSTSMLMKLVRSC